MRSTGTTKGIATWLRSQRNALREGSIFELHALTGLASEGTQLVGAWQASESEDELAFGEVVCAAADADADGRGTTTRYELRHVRDERTRGVTHLRRVIAQEPSQDESAIHADGTTQGLLAQLQRSQREAYGVVLESTKSTVQTQQALLALLGQAYQAQGQLQAEIMELRSQLAEQRSRDATGEGFASQAMRELLTVAGPEIAKHLLGAGGNEGNGG